MPFCTKCGTDVSGVQFCPQCGTPVADQAAGGGSAADAAPPPSGTDEAGAQTTVEADAGMSNNVAAAMGYIFPLAIVFLLIEPYKTDRYVRFHCFQSIFYWVGTFVLWICMAVAGIALSFVGIGVIIGVLSPLITIGIFVLWIFMMIKAYQGEMFHVPLVGDLADKQL